MQRHKELMVWARVYGLGGWRLQGRQVFALKQELRAGRSNVSGGGVGSV